MQSQVQNPYQAFKLRMAQRYAENGTPSTNHENAWEELEELQDIYNLVRNGSISNEVFPIAWLNCMIYEAQKKVHKSASYL